jgi:hypothetical protein
MDFIKRQAFFLVCGAAAVGGIALGAVGYGGMDSVLSEMSDADRLFKDLQNAASNPVNQTHIDAELVRIQRIQSDREVVMNEAAKFMPYEQLVEGFFPTMSKDKEDQFRRKYVEKLQALLDSPHYGTPANAADIADMRNRMKREEFERTKDRLTSDPGASAPPPVASGPAYTPGMVLTEDGARKDAEARAAMNRAQSIRCYAVRFGDKPSQGGVHTLQIEETVPPTGRMDDRPPEADIWRAQLGLWIQEDVMRVVAAMNEEAARAYRLAHQDDEERRAPWVGIMPVKEVISIRVSDYVFNDSEAKAVNGDEAGGYHAANPLGMDVASFTRSGSIDWYDVIHFNVKLVMDQRDIPEFVAKLCENRLHTLLRISYKSVPPDGRMRGKIYGDEPVVNVLFDFETIMLADQFRSEDDSLRMMPDFVIEYVLELPLPGEAATDGEDGG